MDDFILVESDDSDISVVEVEVPKRPTPPLIQIEDEELILNITQRNSEPVLAKNFIDSDSVLVMTKEANSSQVTSGPNHWTTDMRKFYDDDWGDEDQFIVEKIQEKMDKSPSLWKVSKKDLLHTRNKVRSRNIRCWNCMQHGHHFSLCPDPPYVVKCHMCGTQGHEKFSCPESKCLNCGNHSDAYVYCCFKCRSEDFQVCSRCKLMGHNFINCTDHWRLFHSTIGTTSVTQPENQPYKLDKDLWCCNCGKKGHHYTYCKEGKDNSSFKDTLPFVVSYKRAFTDKVFHNKHTDTHWNKSKQHKKEKYKIDKKLSLNPMHKAIWKGKTDVKNRTKMFKKKRRKERRKIEHF